MIYRWLYDHSNFLHRTLYRISKKIRSKVESGQEKQGRERRDAEYLLISPTNCGRTWLRVMIGKAIQLHFDIKSQNLHYLYSFSEINPHIPSIKAIHERYQQFGSYENKKVILLVRDPRDAMVSRYMQLKAKGEQPGEDISTYLIENSSLRGDYIKIYNDWATGKEQAKAFLLVRYEDLRQNTDGEMKRIFEFLEIPCSESHIAEAVEYASLRNMRKMERQGSAEVRTGVFQTASNLAPDAYKVRKGEVGGYRNYISPEMQAIADNIIRQELDSLYGYL
ncbi:MAG: sulfotransferase domain-containing protein [Leptolyngbyaceae cyanobacterium]